MAKIDKLLKKAQSMQYHYAMVMWYSSEDEAYLVEAPELPGCMADGATPEEAVQAAQTAIRLWIEGARKLGRSVPRPARTRAAALKPLVSAAA
jgi:predicted RNase H-like HicB family nuclease